MFEILLCLKSIPGKNSFLPQCELSVVHEISALEVVSIWERS